MNGNFGENSSSSSSNSSVAYPVNSSSDTSSSVATKPYKPKFHNYKKLDLTKTSSLVMPTASVPTSSSTPSTPSTPSFFSANAGNLVSLISFFFVIFVHNRVSFEINLIFQLSLRIFFFSSIFIFVDASNYRGTYQ